MEIAGNAHSRCNNWDAKAKGEEYGIRMGWFMWPLNFDPIWLLECDGYSNNPEDKKEKMIGSPLLELASLLSHRF
jgi:hypothetical protein